MSACATCGKPVDALRARHTRVEGARILVFCSPACMDGAPASGAPVEHAAPRHSAAVAAVLPEMSMPRRSAPRSAEVVSAPVPSIVRPQRPAPEPEPIPEPEPEPEPAAPAPVARVLSGGVVVDEGALGVGPALTMPVVTVEQLGSRSHRMVTGAGAGQEPTVEVATAPRIASPPLPAGNRRRLLGIGAALLAVVVGGLVATRTSNSKRPHVEPLPGAVTGSGSALGGVTEAPLSIAPVAPVDVAAVKLRATDVLSGYLTSESPRIQRMAAAALGRTQEPRAIAVLAKLLELETTPSTQVELAYALARAGDARGRDRLMLAARSDEREVRVDAGRRLLQLGDQAGVAVMTRYLDVADRRLAAAEALASVGDKPAIAILVGIRADAQADADSVRRATIALGRAGQADVAPALRDLLVDFHFRNAAAAALAVLHDPQARPVLAEQLRLEALCVEGAIALRRLESTLDPAPLLPALVEIMDADKDVAQIAAAEATLILTGPAALAAHD